MSPVGAVFVPFPPKTGTNLLHPRPPPNRSTARKQKKKKKRGKYRGNSRDNEKEEKIEQLILF